MRVLLFSFILLSGMVLADPTCQQLESSIGTLENRLMNTALANQPSDCSHVEVSVPDVPVTDPDVIQILDNFKCSPLSLVDSELTRYQNEEFYLNGINKLKTDVQANQARLRAGTPSTQQQAANDFAEGLTTAATIESLVSAPDIGGQPFLSKIPANVADAAALRTTIYSLCNTNHIDPQANPVCTLSEAQITGSFNDLRALIASGVNANQIHTWRDALAIQTPTGQPYSFRELYASAEALLPKLRANQRLTAAEFRTLRNLRTFRDQPSTLESVRKAMGLAQNISNMYPVERMFTVVEDLKTREEQEMKAKVSTLSALYPNIVTAGDTGPCQDLGSVPKIEMCRSSLSALENRIDNRTPEQRSDISHLVDSLKSTMNFHVSLLGANTEECATQVQASFDAVPTPASAPTSPSAQTPPPPPEVNLPGCLGASGIPELTSISVRIKALQAIKDALIARNADAFRMRNYAIQQSIRNTCYADKTITNVGSCAVGVTGSVSPEVDFLTFSSLPIVAAFVPPDQEINLTDICGAQRTGSDPLHDTKEILCGRSAPPVRANSIAPAAPVPDVDAPSTTPASQRNDGLATSLSNVANILGQSLMFQPSVPPVMANPYGFALPYASGLGALSISDQILIPARMGGYASYAPTAGVPLYTSFTPMTSSYTAVGANRSSYFSR